MKKILVLALALMLVLALAACGGKTDPAPSDGDTTDPGTSQPEQSNNEDNPNMRYGFYLNDTQLEKIDSLGKCEENKTIVSEAAYESYHYAVITVYTWADPTAKFDSYHAYYFFNSENIYDNYLRDYGSSKNILEENKTDLWICVGLTDASSVGQTGLKTYEDILNYCKHGAGGDLVQ